MSLIARATGLLARIQALGWKESALRYYRTGDIHQLYGNQVGTDSFGNLYYEAMPGTAGLGRERWVWYSNKKMEATTIPPEWHQWLHHVVDEIPSKVNLTAFKPYYLRTRNPNMTGTDQAYSSTHYVGNKKWTPYERGFEQWKSTSTDPSNPPL